MYVPTWLTAQSGAPPPMLQAQPAPPVPFYQVLPAPMPAPPVAPPQHFSYPPGGWGPMPHYYQAPAQQYLISYPPGPWPPYHQYYPGLHGHVEEDYEMAKPDKFTGCDPLKLHPFIVSCIMA